MKLEGKTLNFNIPDLELWRKSTVRLETKIPFGKTTEDVANHFKQQAIWGRKLHVKKVIEDMSQGLVYIIFRNRTGRDQVFKYCLIIRKAYVTKFLQRVLTSSSW